MTSQWQHTLLGYPLGALGYWCTWAVLNSANPGRRTGLSRRVREILRLVFSPHFPAVDLDRVRIRLAARFPAIPAHPIGMALGHTVYLQPDRLDDSSVAHLMLLLHELVHVAQFQRFNRMGFARRYAAAILGDRGNVRNPLEREAYAFVESHRAALISAMREVPPMGA